MLERLGLTLLAFAWCGCEAQHRPTSVVLVVVDTLRADHLGAYGHDLPTSPNLDARVRSGRLFEQCWATSSWTLPSFGSLFTGELPSRHQAGQRIPNEPNVYGALSEATPTLAELLAARGFQTGAIVSNPFLAPGSGAGRGFAHYDYVSVDNERVRRADDVVDRAVRWIGQRDGPFFLVVHLFDPHMNYDPAPSSRGRFTAGIESRLSLPVRQLEELRSGALQLDHDDVLFLNAAYDEEIAAVDQEIERLLGWLEHEDRGKECLVVLTSDHGEELFDHGGFEHGHAMWEEVLRVPLLVWGPGVRSGRTSTPVSIADLMPTLLEAVGGAPPADIYGVSLWDHLSRDTPLSERAILAEGKLYEADSQVILRHRMKLVQTDGAIRLYDLRRDPGERHEISAQEPVLSADLARELTARLQQQAPLPPRQAEVDPSSEAALRALGYAK